MIELSHPQLANELEELADMFGIDSDELLTEIVRSGLVAWKIKYIEIEVKELREKGREINKKIFRNTPYYKQRGNKMSVQPVKDRNKLNQMIEFLELKGSKRDVLLLKFGLNTGLRINDILRLKVKHLFDSNGNLNEYQTYLNPRPSKDVTES